MKKSNKIILGTVVGVGITALITISLIKNQRTKEEKAELMRAIEEQKHLTQQQISEMKERLKKASKKEKEELTEEILTDVGNVKVGKFAYPKGGSVNVRTSPNVNNGFVNNLIYEDYKKKVGMILKVVSSTEYGDQHKWYKVQLNEPFRGWTMSANEGYVREDAVTVKNK